LLFSLGFHFIIFTADQWNIPSCSCEISKEKELIEVKIVNNEIINTKLKFDKQKECKNYETEMIQGYKEYLPDSEAIFNICDEGIRDAK